MRILCAETEIKIAPTRMPIKKIPVYHPWTPFHKQTVTWGGWERRRKGKFRVGEVGSTSSTAHGGMVAPGYTVVCGGSCSPAAFGINIYFITRANNVCSVTESELFAATYRPSSSSSNAYTRETSAIQATKAAPR